MLRAKEQDPASFWTAEHSLGHFIFLTTHDSTLTWLLRDQRHDTDTYSRQSLPITNFQLTINAFFSQHRKKNLQSNTTKLQKQLKKRKLVRARGALRLLLGP
jgi:hypothetical protein